MSPEGLQVVQYLPRNRPFGIMRYPSEPVPLDLLTLLSASGYAKDGLFYEPNTANLMGAPHILWESAGLSAWPTGSGGLWESVLDRETEVYAISQRAGYVNDAWERETSAGFLRANQPFCVTLIRGACPPGGERTKEGCYTHLEWPSDAAPGQLRFRFSMAYDSPPWVSARIHAADPWTYLREISCSKDVSSFRDTVAVTFSVIPLDSSFPFWLGEPNDWGRETYTYRVGQGTPAGKMKLSGRNGACKAVFGRIVFRKAGVFEPLPLPAPAQIGSKPTFTYEQLLNVGQSITAEVASIDRRRNEFSLKVTLRGAENEDIEGTQYNLGTPLLKSVTTLFPPVWDPPSTGGWRTMDGVQEVSPSSVFDVKTGMFDRSCSVRVKNEYGEYLRGVGIQALRIFLGHRHTGLSLIGYYLANNTSDLEAKGGRSSNTFTGVSPLYILRDQPLRHDLYCGEWCIFAAGRLLLEHGSVVPDLMRRIPQCQSGPNPGCSHPKLPPGTLWKQGVQVLSALADLQRIGPLLLGPDPYGQILLQPFDYRAPYRVKQIFREQESYKGALDSIHYPLVRHRSLDDVKNSITLAGIKPETGQLFSQHYLDYRSLFDQTAPNHTGFIKPFFHAWAGYFDEGFMAERLKYLAGIMTLPEETVQFSCWGQQGLFERDVIVPQERRTVGFSTPYYLSGVFHTWSGRPDAMNKFVTSLFGQWTGRYPAPGYS